MIKSKEEERIWGVEIQTNGVVIRLDRVNEDYYGIEIDIDNIPTEKEKEEIEKVVLKYVDNQDI